MRPRHSLLLLAAFALAACTPGDSTSPPATAEPPATGAHSAEPPPPPDLATWTADPAPSGEPGTPRGLEDLDPATVDEADASAVAAAFTLTMLTADTRIDRSPADVTRRAARWADESYAATLVADRPAGGGHEWVALGESQGYLTAELHTHPAVEAGLIDPGPDDLSVEVPVLATVTAHDAELPEREVTALVSLHRTDPGAPWRVYDWTQEDYR